MEDVGPPVAESGAEEVTAAAAVDGGVAQVGLGVHELLLVWVVLVDGQVDDSQVLREAHL